MKLSEAIRLGEFIPRGCRGQWFTRNKDGKQCGGCAIGRSLLSVGYDRSDDAESIIQFVEEMWPWTATVVNNPPPKYRCYLSTSERPDNHIINIISALYEKGGWSLPQLADYVATIEPADVPAAEPVEALEAAC